MSETSVEPTDLTDEDRFLNGIFAESDADERGWIVYRESIMGPDGKPATKVHRVPVKYWPLYEKLNGF